MIGLHLGELGQAIRALPLTVGRRMLAVTGWGLVALVLLGIPPAAFAQADTTATQNLSCLGTRANSTLSCNAGDLTATASLSAAAGTALFCQAGQSFDFNADVTFNKQAGNTRYDIGFFTGQSGNSPEVNDSTKQCSVATFPFNAPFSNQETGVASDVCGDIKGGLTNALQTVRNIKVTCLAASPTDSNLAVPFALSWRQNSNFTCTGPGVAGQPAAGDVYTDTGPKCSKGTAEVTVSTQKLQVGGYVDVIKQTSPDGDTQPFFYTATGPNQTMVGYQLLNSSGVPTGAVITNNNNSVGFSLTDGKGVRVFLSVVAANRTLNIVESKTTHWSGTAAITCAPVTGSPGLSTNNANRTISAVLNTTNSAAACTIVNTKRARVSLVERVAGRLYAGDQFSLSVSGAGAAQLTTDTAGALLDANLVRVTTSGTGAGPFTNATNPRFRATPGLNLILTNTMAAGSTSTLASYDTTLSCTNAFTGPGATTALPANAPVSSYLLNPAPGDDITCTYTNTPRALLTLSKVVVNDDGRTAAAADWTLVASGPTAISGPSGSAGVTKVPVSPGTYLLTESGPAGYALAGLACTGSSDPNPSDGLALVPGEIATCTFTNDDQRIAQTVAKEGVLELDPDGSGSVTVGDTLRYTVTVTNTGLVPLTGVTISDALLSPGTQSCPIVAKGATCVLSGTHVVTAADASAGQVVNTASVTSVEIPGPVASNTVTIGVQATVPGALAVTKSHAGDFPAGGTASYTLLVHNVGNTPVSGTTTVQDPLPTGLGFVSGIGDGWTCGAVGQLVTCTSNETVPAYADLPAVTLTVSVAGGIGNSVDNTASVGNSSLNAGSMVPGNTDTAAIRHPDLSTSAKGVVDLNGGDVEAGDVLEYRINLVESAGVVATNVSVTDILQAGLGNLQVTQVPGGGIDSSTPGRVEVSGINVPANGSMQLLFRVTVGSGFSPGEPIDNTAVIDNPGGPGASPAARTLVFDQSGVGDNGNKILYLHDNLDLDRTPPTGMTTGGVLVQSGGSASWVLAPAIPTAESLVLSAGAIAIDLPVTTAYSTVDLGAQLFYRPAAGPDVLIGTSATQSFQTDNSPEERTFVVNLDSDYTLSPRGMLVLRMFNNANGNGKDARIFEFNGIPATITFATSTVVSVDSVQAYSQAYATGNAQQAYYIHGDKLWIRAVTSDPFGGEDVSRAELTIIDPYGNQIVGPTPMSIVDTDDPSESGNRTFEYATTVPALADIGMWTATVTAHEGTEGTVWHTASGHFEVRGRVTLEHTWGAGAHAGDQVQLQVTGGSDAVDGSSTAPSTTTPATASATATATITLAQAFTTGNAGTYTMALACTRNADGADVAVTGSGLVRQIQMPLDSSVTCIWNNAMTAPLTIVKLVLVQSDPVNGTVNPKAIPGAIVEYQVIVTNPGEPADSDTVVVSDPLPPQTEFRVADITGEGSGSGPVRFIDSMSAPSGLTYSYPADVAFSSNNGGSWDYVPSDPDGDGIDPDITDIRISPKGTFNGGNAQFTVSFRVRIK